MVCARTLSDHARRVVAWSMPVQINWLMYIHGHNGVHGCTHMDTFIWCTRIAALKQAQQCTFSGRTNSRMHEYIHLKLCTRIDPLRQAAWQSWIDDAVAFDEPKESVTAHFKFWHFGLLMKDVLDYFANSRSRMILQRASNISLRCSSMLLRNKGRNSIERGGSHVMVYLKVDKYVEKMHVMRLHRADEASVGFA